MFPLKRFSISVERKVWELGEEGWELVKTEPIGKAALLLQGNHYQL